MNKGSGDSCLVHELEKQRTRKAEPQCKRGTDIQLPGAVAFPESPHFHFCSSSLTLSIRSWPSGSSLSPPPRRPHAEGWSMVMSTSLESRRPECESCLCPVRTDQLWPGH